MTLCINIHCSKFSTKPAETLKISIIFRDIQKKINVTYICVLKSDLFYRILKT